MNIFKKGSSLETKNTFTASAADAVPLIVKGAAGQTANLQEWQDSTGAVNASMNASGILNAAIGLANSTTLNNALVNTAITGTVISRNVADANTALTIDQTNASSTGKILDLQFAGASKASVDKWGVMTVSGLSVNTTYLRILATDTPASASASGSAGSIKWDANYIYVCVGTNTWKRAELATWE